MSDMKDKSKSSAAPASEGQGVSAWRRRGWVFWVEWLKPLLIIGMVMFSFRSAVADWNDVPTGSMKPTILEGDRIFINKIAYDLKVPFTTIRLAQWDDPVRGDVIVLKSPQDGKRLVKRVVGTPGDLVEVRRNRLYINEVAVSYSMLDPEIASQVELDDPRSVVFASEDLDGRRHPVMIQLGSRSVSHGPFRVPEHKFFVLGDNRNNSRDSRFFGPVDRNLILGQATAVALSLDRENYFKPRWGRFFSSLP